ncbi:MULTISPECIES: helix-turn-helix transcriptional regulator [Serratia]|jgi:predicted DNA-binding transcriptional regulator AlpA|uniref:Transcriptional regulator n=1 Tax=Serratia proteamaculans TaxID=28151 RepID=A0A5Q2VD16_SERPR|nr:MULTISPECIES: AlpA family phage regulatory protein [Serratia]QGH61481.1 transcriptional regulator [Serratia proteamaculans]CUW01958.1 Prophage CP4-57 regulatory protein (AlpA) [Serratia grimesii]SMZ54536.1 Prophage CP4-57 regulatory protein (AlpA) [Serratia grimesii]HDS5482442.1 transcriptional regulator [Serratia liquefaciens]HDU8662855.1 transcriptional regulator [Serratia liquefaciens]
MTFINELTTAHRPPMDALIDMKFITADCLLSDKWIYRLISQERFPRPIKLGRMSRWRAADYYSWRDDLESSSSTEYEKSRLKANNIREGKSQGITGRH